MTVLWTFADLVRASGGVADGDAAPGVTGFSIDTRTLQAGDAFVALKDQRDGHDFVSSAFKAGAAVAIVANPYVRKAGDGVLIRVGDSLKALESIGRAARARLASDARVIAVTGSAGKTTTKEMLRTCLARVAPGRVHASEKSYNNHWGVPLTLARMPKDAAFAVFEIGMNHAGEIAPLSQMVRPHAAIVTTVEAVHLEHFPNVQAIADAKAEIFTGLETGGVAIIKRDNPHAVRLAAAARTCGAEPVMFAVTPGEGVAAIATEFGAVGTALSVRLARGQVCDFTLALPGRHNAENACAVAAALEAIGAEACEALGALAQMVAPPGRGARTLLKCEGGEMLLIDESYNANPASMRAALATLSALPRDKFPRRIAVLGDMLELGPEAEALHVGLLDPAVEAGADVLFACGPLMKGLYDAAPAAMKGGYAETATDLLPLVLADVRAGDAVMVKASNGTRLGSLVDGLRTRFAAALAER